MCYNISRDMNPHYHKKQSIRVIVSEAIMVLAVIVTVIILALLVSGYWLNSDFTVERNGMLQISSIPTGANVEIDGQASSWLERTNSSKILGSGEHSVVLTKDGYDSWSKTVIISEGLLYRLQYPRLFLKERTTEAIDIASSFTSASISPDGNLLLLMNDTTEWLLMNLDADTPSTKKLDISSAFSTVSLAEGAKVGLFTGKILDLDWDQDSSHNLFKVENGDKIEWVLLDTGNVAKSVNLTKEFGGNFSELEILDNGSNQLLAIQNGNLHKIDIPGRLISAVLAKNILDFDHFGNEIVYSAKRIDQTPPVDGATTQEPVDALSEYYVGYLKLGDDKTTELEPTTAPVKVAIGKFYDSKYIAVLTGQSISIHQKDSYLEDIEQYQISFTPDAIKVGHDGGFLILSQVDQLATLDLEANLVREWSIEHDHGWLDHYMFYAVSDNNLVVYDFDGLNRRELSHNVSSHFPITITSDKWLYYFRDGGLIREWLIPR